MNSQVFSGNFEHEVYPEGYAEALAECTVLAAKLLKIVLVEAKEETS
jgi:hypothetical protein